MKHVLFVHDRQEDPFIRRHWLENSGFLVTLADRGEDAIEIIESEEPDCVLLDVLLKGKNGFLVLDDIRRRWTKEELPVILCSRVLRQRRYREEAWDRGAQGYLLRPVDPTDLVRHIVAVTRGRESSAERGKAPAAS